MQYYTGAAIDRHRGLTKKGIRMKKALSILWILILALALVACSSGTTASPSPSDEATPSASTSPSDEPTPSDEPSPTEKLSVSAGFLKGPTGIGASYLMEQADAGNTLLDYTFTVESDPSIVTSSIISGDLDIAAVPTNVASVLYNKTEGAVKIVAVNTLSVLYILENGNSVQSVADLAGKTIYAMGQAANPEYVLNYILRQNGLEPGEDVTVEYMDAGELATKMTAGDIDIAMLPVPMSTTVLVKNADVRVALDIGDEWEAVTGGNTLAQGCIVVRADIDNVDEVVADFLADYETSMAFMMDEATIDEAAALAAQYEIVPSEAIAKAALPDSGLIFIAGADNIKNSISGYFDVLFTADPKSLGGAIPDDAFYFDS